MEQHTDLPVDIEVVAGSGSGEILERDEYLRLQELIQYGEYDLVLPEDLGRIARRVYAFVVCELCEDHGVRLIAINNHNVDTGCASLRSQPPRAWPDANPVKWRNRADIEIGILLRSIVNRAGVCDPEALTFDALSRKHAQGLGFGLTESGSVFARAEELYLNSSRCQLTVTKTNHYKTAFHQPPLPSREFK